MIEEEDIINTAAKNTVFVYLSDIDSIKADSIFLPDIRQNEINNCKNVVVKNQKERVWSLLCHALRQSFGIDARQIIFEKTQNGKWISDKCCFSISHSGNILVAAVSKTPIGVDIEKIDAKRMTERLAQRILTDSEKCIYNNTAANTKAQFLTDAWTAKESVFKLKGEKNFCPNLIPANLKKRLFVSKSESKFYTAKTVKQKSIAYISKRNSIKIKTINVYFANDIFSLSVATQDKKISFTVWRATLISN